MAKGAVLALKITGDASGAKRAFADADGAGGKFGGKMAGIAAAAGVALGAVATLGKAAFDSASNLQQQAGAVDAVFGKNAAKMHDYAAQAASTVGLATSEYDQLASVLGAQLSNAGFAGDKLTGSVNGLVEKGADLAAQFGGSTADAVEALSSVLKGETDPIEKYGVSIKQSDITARLAAKGQDQLTGAALKQAQAQAALDLVTQQTQSSVGAFARETDTAAGSGAILSAKWEDLKAKLGQGLLPVFTAVAGFLGDKVIPVVERLLSSTGPLGPIFAQVGAFVTGQLVPAMAGLWNELGPKLVPMLQTAGRIITGYVVPAFQGIWKVVQTYVVPIIKSVLGPALDGVQKMWRKLEEALDRNRDKFSGLLEKVRPLLEFLRDKVAPLIGGILKTYFSNLATVIGKVVDAIAWILDKGAAIGGFIGKVGSAIFGAAPAGAAPARGAAAPMFGAVAGVGGGRLYGAAGGTGTSTSTAGVAAAAPVVNITVNGALDPVAVGRQINDLVRRYAQTTNRSKLTVGAR